MPGINPATKKTLVIYSKKIAEASRIGTRNALLFIVSEESSKGLTEDQKTIQELRERILQLEQQIDWFNRQLFGNKSEKLNLAKHPDLFDPVGLGTVA